MLFTSVVIMYSKRGFVECTHHHFRVNVVWLYALGFGGSFNALQFRVIKLSVQAEVGIVNVTPSVNDFLSFDPEM